MHIDGANDDSSLLQREPGSDIGIMIKGGYDDLVTGVQCLADGAAEGEGEGGHIRAEDDLTGAGGMQEIGHCTASSSDHLVGALTGDKSSLGVGIRLAEVGYHSVYDLLRHLGPTGVIEIDGLFVIDGLCKGGEVTAVKAQVECLRHRGQAPCILWLYEIREMQRCEVMVGANVTRCTVTSNTMISILQNRDDHLRGAAAFVRGRPPGGDGYPGLESAAVLVHGRRWRSGDPARCRASVRQAHGCNHRRSLDEPRGDGLPPG